MTDTTNTEMIRLSELNSQLERERNDLRYEANALCVNLLYLLRTGATKEQIESRIDSARTKIRAAASTPASGSVTPQRVGDDWMEYLDSTGNISRYDGMCDCYVCRRIKADYFPWKARKEEAKSLNAPHEPRATCDSANQNAYETK